MLWTPSSRGEWAQTSGKHLSYLAGFCILILLIYKLTINPNVRAHAGRFIHLYIKRAKNALDCEFPPNIGFFSATRIHALVLFHTLIYKCICISHVLIAKLKLRMLECAEIRLANNHLKMLRRHGIDASYVAISREARKKRLEETGLDE